MSKAEYQKLYHPSKSYSEWFEHQSKKEVEGEEVKKEAKPDKPRKRSQFKNIAKMCKRIVNFVVSIVKF